MKYFTVAGPGDEDKAIVWLYTLNRTNPELTPIIFHHPAFNAARLDGAKVELVEMDGSIGRPLSLIGAALDTLAERSHEKVTYLSTNCWFVGTLKGWENIPLTKELCLGTKSIYEGMASKETARHIPHFVPAYPRRAKINPNYYDTAVFSCLPREILARVKDKKFDSVQAYVESTKWVERDDWLNYLVKDTIHLQYHLNAFPNVEMPVDFKEVVKTKRRIATAAVMQFKPGFLPWEGEDPVLCVEHHFEMPYDTYGLILDELRSKLSMDFRQKAMRYVELYASSNRWVVKIQRVAGNLRSDFLRLGKAIEQNCLVEDVVLDDPREVQPAQGGDAEATQSKLDEAKRAEEEFGIPVEPTAAKRPTKKRNKRKKKKRGRR